MDNGSVSRVVARNAHTQENAATRAPEQTVAHGMAVEARLVQAIAARKKKERTAGGKSAAELADSILSASEPASELLGLQASSSSGLDFLDAVNPPELPGQDDLGLGALFETKEALVVPPADVRATFQRHEQQPTPPTIICDSADVYLREEQSEGGRVPPKNRSRLRDLLDNISGEDRG